VKQDMTTAFEQVQNKAMQTMI